MLYFSEIKGRKVYSEDGIEIGFLDDLIFLAIEKPKITKIIFLDKNKKKYTVSIDYVNKINGSVIISKNYLVTELQDNELSVLKNLLDKQIIDIGGNKIVRVNDVAFQKEGEGWYIYGVDVGFLGITRWFGLENTLIKLFRVANVNLTPRFLSWADIQPLELARGKVKLKKEEDKLERLRPEDLADHLEQTNLVSARRILRLLDDKFAAEVISNLNINYQSDIFRHFRPEKAAQLIDLIDIDEAVDIILSLSKKRREDILNLLPETKRKSVLHLIGLSKTTIGGLLTTEFITVSSNCTVAEAIGKIKKETEDFYFLNYVYVVNNDNQLVGVFNLHKLLLQNLDVPVYKFMTQNVIIIHLTTPGEIAIKKMLKYKIQALPVINEQKNMIGIVNVDDLTKYILKKFS